MWECQSEPGHRATKSGLIVSGCAARVCGRSKSGCRTLIHAPSRRKRAANRLPSPRVPMLRKISASLTQSLTGMLSETRRDLDRRWWQRLRPQAPPGCIVQDDRFDALESITICPFTTDATDAPLFRLPIEPNDRNGLQRPSRLMLDKITTVRRSKIDAYIGRLDDEDLVRLNRAILVFLGLAGATAGAPSRRQ
jgi:mRNA interferase MazF